MHALLLWVRGDRQGKINRIMTHHVQEPNNFNEYKDCVSKLKIRLIVSTWRKMTERDLKEEE